MQRDFGGFDPAFVGVTLRFENAEAWGRFQQITRSPTPLSVSGLTSDERFETLSLASVISHEVRHFHDFLLSPYAARIFSLRVKTLINEMGMLPRFADRAVNCLPVPVPRWLRLDAAQRDARIAELGARPDGTAWSPPVMAESPAIDAAARAREQLQSLLYNPTYVGDRGSFQPWQVLELSGLLVQIHDVYAQYGGDEAAFFINALNAEGEGKNPYARMFHLAKSVWDHLDRDFDTGIASAMTTWSMLGAYGVDAWDACPSERFVRLWGHLRANGVEEWRGGVMDLFDEWSAALNLSTVSEGLRETAQIYSGRAASLLNVRAQLADALGENDAGAIANLVSTVAAASAHMIEAFMSDADAYVNPRDYLSAVGGLVNPVLRYAADAAGFDVGARRPELEQRGYKVLWARVVDGKELIYSWLVPFDVSPAKFVNPVEAAAVADMFGITDFLFAESGRARNDVQLPGIIFCREGKIAWFDLLD